MRKSSVGCLPDAIIILHYSIPRASSNLNLSISCLNIRKNVKISEKLSKYLMFLFLNLAMTSMTANAKLDQITRRNCASFWNFEENLICIAYNLPIPSFSFFANAFLMLFVKIRNLLNSESISVSMLNSESIHENRL